MIVRELITKIGFQVDEASLRKAENRITATAKKMNDIGKKMTAFITLPIVGLGIAVTKSASDAIELRNKFNQVFRGIETDANQFATTFGRSVGRAPDTIREGLSAFQSFTVGLGFGADQAFEMSKRLQRLVTDFSSFNNLTEKESLQRFISAMSGSSEVVDRFGINLKQSALQLKLQELGFSKNIQKATEQEKAIARLAIIEDSLGRQGALGDAVRTLGEFANRMRVFREVLKEARIEFGLRMLPTLNKALGVLIRFTKVIRDMSPNMRRFIIVWAALAAAVGPVLLGVSALLLPMGLLAAKILIISGLIALLVDDFIAWNKGYTSVIGTVLISKEELINAYKAIGQAFENFFFNVMMGDLEALQEQFKIFTKSIVILFQDLTDTLMRIPGIKQLLQLVGGVAGIAGRVTGDIQSRRIPFTQQGIFAPANLSNLFPRAGNSQNVNVTSTIEMVVPEGTEQQQISSVRAAAEKAVNAIFSKHIRHVLSSNPAVP